MRSLRLSSLFLAFALTVSVAALDAPFASAQSVGDAEQDADEARANANAAAGLVDEAVSDREAIEVRLTETIARLNELAAQLSVVGAGLDRVAEQLGFADVELAGIKNQIEVQAVDAYMTVVASPSFSLINSDSVEEALVASSVVEDVVSAGKETVDQLVIKRQDLEELQALYLASQNEFAVLQEEVDAQAEQLAVLYEEADRAVAEAVREAQAADAEYRAALTTVDLARAREAERKRQEQRSTTTTTTPSGPTTTSPSSPATTGTSPTTTQPAPTTTSGAGGGSWNHPPEVEQWRSLVSAYFPSNRVEEALKIIDCESNGDAEAYNPYSGASGLFQFLPSTWASTAPKAGWSGYSVFDPEANVSSAAWLANRYEELGNYYWHAWNCKRVLN